MIGERGLDGQQLSLQGFHHSVQVLVAGGKGIKSVADGTQHIQVHHGVNLIGVGGKGTVEEIPGAGKGLGRCPESHKQHAAAQRLLIAGNNTGNLRECGHSRGVRVSTRVDSLLRDSVYVYGVITQMVKMRPNHNVFLTQVGVGALYDSHYVAGGDGVAGGGDYCEGVSSAVGEHCDANLFKAVVEV